MDEFPGNSKNVTEGAKTEKVITKVVTGEVIQRKKSIGRKFKEIFFGGEFKGAGRYILADVLLPALRNLVVDTTTEGIKRAVYGESAARRRATSITDYRPRISYNNPVDRSRSDPRNRTSLPHQPPYVTRSSHQQIGDLILVSREEAEVVVERMVDIIDKYDVVSVSDLKGMIGHESTYIDNKWGWSYLGRVEIRQVRDGYLIDLPPAEQIQ